MQIELPRKLSDLRQYHLEAIAGLSEDMDVYDKLKLLTELTSLDMETLRRVSIKQVNKIISHYFALISSHKTTEKPKKNINVGGKEYQLISSIGEQPLAWHIDIGHFGTEDASNVAAFCYIEKGKEYCEMDKHSNIINPVTPRATNFKLNLGADVLIDLGFFLDKKSKEYKNAFMEIRKQRSLKVRKKEKSLDLNGRITSMQSVKSLD